jgi:predicted DNA-binding transcriptional regulator AlpA
VTALRVWSPAEVRVLAAREVTVSVERAAETIGMARSTAYASIRQGTFPFTVIQVSAKNWIVTTASILQVLGLDPPEGEEGWLRAVP